MSKPSFSESDEQVPVTYYRCKSTIQAGLRQSWIDGEDSSGGGVEFSLNVGVGTPYLIFAVTTPDGVEHKDVVDVREMMSQRVNQAMSEFRHRQKIEAKAEEIRTGDRLCAGPDGEVVK